MDEQNGHPQRPHRLGPILYSCRPMPVLEWQRLLGGFPPAVTVVIAIFCCVVLAFMAAGFVLGIRQQIQPAPLDRFWVWVIITLCFAAISPLYVWGYFIAPTKDFLILHEKGFRYRLNGSYPSSEFLFSQIRSLEVGDKIEGSWIEKTLKIVRPGIGKNLAFRRQTALEVRLKNGSVKRIEFLLARFDPDDTEKFVTSLKERFEQVKSAELADWSM